MTGRIKALQPSFGFITADDGSDLFFHRTDVAGGVDFDNLVVGDRVTFAPADPPPLKGPRALEVVWQAREEAV